MPRNKQTVLENKRPEEAGADAAQSHGTSIELRGGDMASHSASQDCSVEGELSTAGSHSTDRPGAAREEPPRNWGNPFVPKYTSKAGGFEMGENHRYKQRVFIFSEKPDESVIATLKESGFTYRAAEKAWTIPANPDTRRLSEELAQKFAGQDRGMSR